MLWRLFPSVRPSERARFAWLAVLGGVLTLAQTVGLAGAEALFLTRLGTGRLPETFVLASAVTVAVSLLYAVRVGRQRNDRVFVELLIAFALAVAAAAAALRLGQVAALPALLCIFFAAQAVLLSHYWTFAGDLFDTLATKRLVALLTAGMSFGGLIGGGAAILVLTRASAEALIWAWALSFGVAAGGLVALRGRVASWRTLAGAEEDETSVAGIQAALRSLRRSALGRWLVVSALAMVLALFVAQYIYAEIMVRAFPSEAALASFLALYLTVSNAVEIAVELLITPWLIRRTGVPAANLAHPLLTLLAFGGLFVSPFLAAAVVARANRELMESALAGPVRNLVYNALPGRIRSRVRAFLEGIVIYAGMSLAGVALLAAEGSGIRLLSAIGAGLSLVYLLANVRVRREYVGALTDELRAGRLDLATLRDELGPRELGELAELWAHLVRSEPGDPGEAVLELAPVLAARGFADTVRGALDHPSARLRATCLEALASAPEAPSQASADAAAAWQRGLGDTDASVRLAAVRTLPEPALADPSLRALLDARLDDPAHPVRAAAAARLGEAGAAALEAMVASEDRAAAEAALQALPAPLAALARARALDPDPALRAAALAALARAGRGDALSLEALAEASRHEDSRVRRAAVAALATRAEPEAATPLAARLRDGAREVRSAAVDAVAARGEAGAWAAREVLEAPEESSVGAALRAIHLSNAPEAGGWLRGQYVARVREAFDMLLLEQAFAADGPWPDLAPPATTRRFLRVASADASARALRLALRALALVEEPGVVRSVARTLRSGSGRSRADALEVVSNLGDRQASQVLAVLLEGSSADEKLLALRALGTPPRPEAALTRACEATAPWVRRAAEAAAPSGDAGEADRAMMEKLLALRSVSLFSGLSLERLQAVLRISTEAQYAAGDVIVREGEPGDELFLLVEGEVDVLKRAGERDQKRLASLGPGDYFGEMAVLDGQPRSASIVARGDVRALVLSGARLRELLYEMPALSLDLLRKLGERVRRAEEPPDAPTAPEADDARLSPSPAASPPAAASPG